MQAPLALFNGSYVGQRPTGIGVVARDLAAALGPDQLPALWPQGMAPDQGNAGHARRLWWTQTQLPALWRASGAPLLLSPLPEAPLLAGVPSVVLAHDLLPLRYPQLTPLLAYHLAYVPLVLRRARHVLCNSEATAREVHGRIGVPTRRLSVLKLGFNPGQLRPLGLAREPELLVLGRHDPHKNLRRLLQAVAALRDREHRIHFVGPHDRRYTPKLQAMAQELGIASRCRWTAWVSNDERLELLNRARALVIPSLWEGFASPGSDGLRYAGVGLHSRCPTRSGGGGGCSPRSHATRANGSSHRRLFAVQRSAAAACPAGPPTGRGLQLAANRGRVEAALAGAVPLRA